MNKLPRKTIREVASEMRTAVPDLNDSGDNPIGLAVLDEDLWGMRNGIYRPLAQLSLPVLYGIFPEFEEGEGHRPEPRTEFNKAFFIGNFSFKHSVPDSILSLTF